MHPTQIAIGLFCMATIAAGQILLKMAAQATLDAPRLLSLQALSPALVAGAALYGISMAAYIYLLRSVELSVAYLFVLTGAALVPVAAGLVFGETLGARYFLGLALLLAGLWIMRPS